MCLAEPALVKAVLEDGAMADVVVHGRDQRVLLTVLDEDAQQIEAGDWLLVHSGVALGRIDATDAALRTQLLEQAYGGGS